jgi:hypothetical protein
MFDRGRFLFAATALLLLVGAGISHAQQPSSQVVKPEVREAWRKSMVRQAVPKNGCFKAEYPSTRWEEVRCGRPSPYPNFPCTTSSTVGDGCDFVAQASSSNLISSAEGSFPNHTGVSVVTGLSGDVAQTSTSVADVFELQLNTQSEFNRLFGFNSDPGSFSTPACTNAPNGASGCYGWQQFLFSQTQGPAPDTAAGQKSVPGATGTTPGLFIEYWLMNWGTPCPALPSWDASSGTWTSDGAGDCWFNGPMTYVAPQTAATLPDIVMTASATSTQDKVVLSTTSGMYVYQEDNVLSLSAAWTQAEFNIFGDCCLTQVNFTSPTVLFVNVALTDGSTAAPSCLANDGTTGETNNLTLVPASSPVCCPYGGASPAIGFMQVIDTAHTHSAWCGPTTVEGDPHITTADGTHYNFQGAGEFVTLRDADGAEIQTRETPVSTNFIGTDPYDGLTTCVSLNTAVAARVGKHRVTWEPNLNGVPDPAGLQLRIDGALTTLGAQGVELAPGGRVAPQAGGALEVDFPDGKTLLVTPQWWASQSEWYLNVDVSHLGLVSEQGSVSGSGIAGAIAAGSWLPALPNGTSVGAMPAGTPARYATLYRKFGDAWRVSDKDSLFDYAPGTSTSSFTNREWPSETAPCVVRGSTPLQAGSDELAVRACQVVRDKNRHADCIFDVKATGDTTFAKTYLATQRILTNSTSTELTAEADAAQVGEWVNFTASVIANSSGNSSIPGGAVQFAVDGLPVGEPVTLTGRGAATWGTSRLKIGTHRITATYEPGTGTAFLGSTSAERRITVRGCLCDKERK